MQRSREKQKGKHAVEHRFLEVDLPDNPREVFVRRYSRKNEFDTDEHERGDKPHDEQADRVRQPDEAMIDPGERSRQHQEHGDEIENRQHLFDPGEPNPKINGQHEKELTLRGNSDGVADLR